MPRNYNQPSQINIERVWMRLRSEVDLHEQMSHEVEAKRARDELDEFEISHPSVDFSGLHAQFRQISPSLVELERRWMELMQQVETISDGDRIGKAQAKDKLRHFELRHRLQLNFEELRDSFALTERVRR